LDFWQWIGLNTRPALSSARWLGGVVGAAFFGACLVLVGAGIATLLHFASLVFQTEPNHIAIRNVGLVLAGFLGAPFVIWRAFVAQKQANTAEQSHITDQISKAVAGLGSEKTVDRIGRPVKIYAGKKGKISIVKDHETEFTLPEKSIELRRYKDLHSDNPFSAPVLRWFFEIEQWDKEFTRIEWQGSVAPVVDGETVALAGDWSVFSETLPNIEVRLGAIYALERIAQDSPRDHLQIMEILTAYVRQNSAANSLKPTEPPFERAKPRADIHAALDVIGRRPRERIELEHARRYRLDLRGTDLSGGNFTNGNFDGAILSNCRLEGCNFREASLVGARLNGSLLNFTEFLNCDLGGAIFDHATINMLGDWGGSFTLAKNTKGISLAGADVTAISLLQSDGDRGPTFGTLDTKLSSHLQHQRKNISDKIHESCMDLQLGRSDKTHPTFKLVADAGFAYWSPFESTDGATGHIRKMLWRDLGLQGFPYEDA
jgi:hypothetical protein